MRESKTTKERILDTAEQLFAEQGFVGTSLRDVTVAAKVNLAAVNYHFGSKDALLQAVVHRVLAVINDARRERLDALRSTGQPLSVEAVLEAFAYPVFDLSQDAHGRTFRRLLGRTLTDPSEPIRAIVIEEARKVEQMYMEIFTQILPDVPKDELWWRFRSSIGVLVSHLIGLLADPDSNSVESTEGREWTISFLAAGLRAPATSRPT